MSATQGRILVLALSAQEELAHAICTHLSHQSSLNIVPGDALMRQFPDGEHYLRLHSQGVFDEAIVIGSLHQPDRAFLPLHFLSDLARLSGAKRVGLVAPYLGYLRQDERFHPGELITAQSFARLLERSFDSLITVDPHLHRLTDLSEIYTIPTRLVRSAATIAHWIRGYTSNPLIVGPDSESDQWTRPIADLLGAPLLVMSKTRFGDSDVQVQSASPQTVPPSACPILIDDIISTGRTMIAAAQELQRLGFHAPPICIGVHPVFAPSALEHITQLASPHAVLSCNTIPHPTNAIDLSEPIAAAIAEHLKILAIT